jgi:hypothetical protein
MVKEHSLLLMGKNMLEVGKMVKIGTEHVTTKTEKSYGSM